MKKHIILFYLLLFASCNSIFKFPVDQPGEKLNWHDFNENYKNLQLKTDFIVANSTRIKRYYGSEASYSTGKYRKYKILCNSDTLMFGIIFTSNDSVSSIGLEYFKLNDLYFTSSDNAIRKEQIRKHPDIYNSCQKCYEDNFLKVIKEKIPETTGAELNASFGIKAKFTTDPFYYINLNKMDTISWVDYYFKYDTIIAYPFLNKVGKLDFKNFTNYILEYSDVTKQKNNVNQFHNLFSINNDYTGYIINDSIFINAYYRRIGDRRQLKTIFSRQDWSNFIQNAKHDSLFEIKQNSNTISRNEYSKIDIFSKLSEQNWMHNNKFLK